MLGGNVKSTFVCTRWVQIKVAKLADIVAANERNFVIFIHFSNPWYRKGIEKINFLDSL